MPKGVYTRTAANRPKPRDYPADVVALVRRLYLDEGMTVAEVQRELPRGFKAQRIIERHIPVRRPAAKRDQRGAKNAHWKGDDATYGAVHLRLGPAADHACTDCAGTAAEWSYLGGCPRERVSPRGVRYSPDPARYVARCVPCHRRHDAALRAEARP